MPRLKRDERDQVMSETRRRLLDAAANAFAHEGYNGANVNRISRDAGFAKGTIYNYFASKHALMLALIDDVAAIHFEYLASRVLEVEEPVDRMRRFFEAGFAFVSDYLPQGRVMVNTIYGHDEAFKTHMYEVYQPMFALVARDIVGAGSAQGVFPPTDPAATSQIIMTVYLATASQVNEEGRPWLDHRQVSTFVLKALTTEEIP